ncbi:unnamed protein product [Notodromas monacha]|uniref:Uncharacterized protein n=1 Tax=Notodromas monacha TaxID=399045 RepID=A0A7R9GFC3_9CRUS|nr:unnamed protein product [Notodromas monacha]CAG0918996.1 unnamed protein product [Notodromas monacha]
MKLMRQGTSSTSTLAKLPFCCSNLDEIKFRDSGGFQKRLYKTSLTLKTCFAVCLQNEVNCEIVETTNETSCYEPSQVND